jgi:hypothetical protein
LPASLIDFLEGLTLIQAFLFSNHCAFIFFKFLHYSMSSLTLLDPSFPYLAQIISMLNQTAAMLQCPIFHSLPKDLVFSANTLQF